MNKANEQNLGLPMSTTTEKGVRYQQRTKPGEYVDLEKEDTQEKSKAE